MPEQIRLSITRRPDEMVVTWVTPYWAGTSMVAYGKAASTLSDRRWTQDNDEYDFKGGYGAEHYARSVRLRYLEPNTQYFYRVGNDKQGWSQVFWFKTREADINATTTFAVVADQVTPSRSFKTLSMACPLSTRAICVFDGVRTFHTKSKSAIHLM